jgi:hypothetical protein
MASTKYRVGSILFDGELWWYEGMGRRMDQGMSEPVPGQMNIGTKSLKDLTFLIKHELEFASEHIKQTITERNKDG